MRHNVKKEKTANAQRGHLPQTLLDAFCRKHNIATARLAALASISPQHTGRLRAGKVPHVTIDTAKLLVRGASRILHRKVAVGELFDLDYFSWWP